MYNTVVPMCIAGLRYETLTVASTMSPRDPPVGRQHPSFAYIDCIERWCLHFSPCGWGDLTRPGVTCGNPERPAPDDYSLQVGGAHRAIRSIF